MIPDSISGHWGAGSHWRFDHFAQLLPAALTQTSGPSVIDQIADYM